MNPTCEVCGKPPAFQVQAYGAFGGPYQWRWFCEPHSNKVNE